MPELNTLGSVIKSTYEAEPDTNAFTDAEKTKLAGLENYVPSAEDAQAIKDALETLPNTNTFTDLDKQNLDEVVSRVPFSGDFADLTDVPNFIQEDRRAAANGVASLDASGKVPLSQLNVSGLQFKGAWNPTTNTPALVDGSGVVGDFYKASVAGSYNTGNGSYTYAVGDWIIYAGGTWNRLGSADSVAMVNGKLGSVVLTAADVGALPDTYEPPAATWAELPDKPTIPSAYVPPKLNYADRAGSRAASTWYTNSSGHDRIVNITTNYTASSASSRINMRKVGTTTPVFAARSQATGTGDTNQIMQAIVPDGWQYQFVPGTSRTVSTWFEGDYA